jgi:hypothetical protein
MWLHHNFLFKKPCIEPLDFLTHNIFAIRIPIRNQTSQYFNYMPTSKVNTEIRWMKNFNLGKEKWLV